MISCDWRGPAPPRNQVRTKQAPPTRAAPVLTDEPTDPSDALDPGRQTLPHRRADTQSIHTLACAPRGSPKPRSFRFTPAASAGLCGMALLSTTCASSGARAVLDAPRPAGCAVAQQRQPDHRPARRDDADLVTVAQPQPLAILAVDRHLCGCTWRSRSTPIEIELIRLDLKELSRGQSWIFGAHVAVGQARRIPRRAAAVAPVMAWRKPASSSLQTRWPRPGASARPRSRRPACGRSARPGSSASPPGATRPA